MVGVVFGADVPELPGTVEVSVFVVADPFEFGGDAGWAGWVEPFDGGVVAGCEGAGVAGCGARVRVAGLRGRAGAGRRVRRPPASPVPWRGLARPGPASLLAQQAEVPGRQSRVLAAKAQRRQRMGPVQPERRRGKLGPVLTGTANRYIGSLPADCEAAQALLISDD